MKRPDDKHAARMIARNAEARFNEIMRQRDTPKRRADLKAFWAQVTIAKAKLGKWPRKAPPPPGREP